MFKFLFLLVSLLIVNFAEEAKYIDVIGNFDVIFEKQLSEMLKEKEFINESLCEPRLLEIGELQFFVSSAPLGFCDYCCLIKEDRQPVKLYYVQSCTTYELLQKLENGYLLKIGIDPALPTEIYIHGFAENAMTPNSKLMCDAYFLSEQKRNLIFIDWGELTTMPWYQQAVKNIDYVKRIVTDFLKFYIEKGEIIPSNLHIIGFSLGAQIAGRVAKNFKEKEKIGRITGLDPAYPSFPLNDFKQRLCKEDAEYVDIIHTDAGKFGYPISIGHVDFYPNDGMFPQPGCFKNMNSFGACNHMRAIELYAESVRNPKAFPVKSSSGFVYMGIEAMNSKAFGDIPLITNDCSPFGISDKTI